MRIIRIHIENFGKLHDFDMEFQTGLNRISAANGWGKTTLAAFLKAMFYGLEATSRRSLRENERKKYLPWQGGTFGGSMEFSVGGKRYRTERFFGTKEREDRFRLYDLETGLSSNDFSERLGEELFHLDRTAYERSSYFAQQDFSVSINDSLNARLTRVEEDAGDMQNYEKAYASLENRMKYYRKTGNRGHIPELQERRRKVLEELEACRTKEAALKEEKREIAQKESENKELQNEIQKLEKQMERGRETLAVRQERLEELRKEAERRRDLLRETQEKLEAFDPAPPEEEELDQCQGQIVRLQALSAQIEEDTVRAGDLDRQAEILRRDIKRGGRETAPFFFAGILLLAGAAAVLLISEQLFPGILILPAGFAVLTAAIVGESRIISRRHEAEKKLHEISIQQASILEHCRMLQKRREELREEIGEILLNVSFDGEEDEHALEEALQKERRRSRRYSELLRDYGTQKREARVGRETYEQFREKISVEEASVGQGLQQPGGYGLELGKRIQRLRERREALQKELGRMQSRVQGLSLEAERIPELEEDAERLKTELTDADREYKLLETTLRYLKEARERFSARYLEQLQRSFQHYRKCLDPENVWEPVLDVKLQVKIPEKGAVRELEYFSAGEQDLIRIAERFAIVDALYEKEQPVLILDDPFVNLDTKRRERALAFLEERSKRRQIIYFTCAVLD